MKETQDHNPDQVENVRQVQVEEQQVLLGSKMLNKNHKIFEVNMVTGDVRIAETEAMPINFLDRKNNKFAPNKRKLVVNKDCRYVAALNVENAMRKLGFAVKIVKKKK